MIKFYGKISSEWLKLEKSEQKMLKFDKVQLKNYILLHKMKKFQLEFIFHWIKWVNFDRNLHLNRIKLTIVDQRQYPSPQT